MVGAEYGSRYRFEQTGKNFENYMDVFDGEGSWIYLPKSIEVFVSGDSI